MYYTYWCKNIYIPVKLCFNLGLFVRKITLLLKIDVTNIDSINKANKESAILLYNKKYEHFNKQIFVGLR